MIPETPPSHPLIDGPASVSSAAPAAAPPAMAAAADAPGGAATAAMERVVQELLEDKRSERRWKTFFRFMWLAVAVGALWTLSPTKGLGAAPAGPHTAMVELRGELHTEGMASADLVIAALRDAFGNPNAKAVVLRINSPGGSPVQAGIINDEILRLKEQHRKKLYAVVEEICASGGYYVAVAADEIYADKASVVGSIGVLMDGFGFTGLMDKLGVERRLITAGENKGMLDPFTPLSPKERDHAKAVLAQVHQQFISAVKAGRGTRLQDDPELFSGLFWNGEEAVRLGLVDALGSVDQVARDVVKAPDVVDYSPRENVAERLVKRFGASVGVGAMQALQAMGLPMAPKAMGNGTPSTR